MSSGPSYSVRAVHRVCDILDLLQTRSEHVTLAEVAAQTGLPKSSALRYLATLEERRYARRDPDGGDYGVGLAFGAARAEGFEVLRRSCRPFLEELRDAFDETVNLGVLDGTRVCYLDSIEPSRGVRLTVPPGARDPIHSTALGKALAAELAAERVRHILAEEGLPARTARTVTTQVEYLRELDAVRERGYAVDDGENEPDGRCVAVTLRGLRLAAAISVSAPAARFPLGEVERVAAALRSTADRVADAATR